jgi:hypothetical protein
LREGQVVNDANIDSLARRDAFAERKIHGKCRGFLALANDLPADADDSPLPHAAMVLEISVMSFAIGRGHEHFDILAQRLFGAVFEQRLASGEISIVPYLSVTMIPSTAVEIRIPKTESFHAVRGMPFP